MRNWSVNTKKLEHDPEKYIKWRLEQLINFGLGKEKLNKKTLSQHLPDLHIDPYRKKFLEFLLHNESHSHSKTNTSSRT